MKFIWFFFVAIWLSNGCRASDDRVLTDVFRTKDRLAIVANPESVELTPLRIVDTSDSGGTKRTYEEEGYQKAEIAVARELSSIMVAPSTYTWDVVRGCYPRFAGRVRFKKGAEVVAADFCFLCNLMHLSIDGRVYSGGIIDGGGPKILAVFKKMFPNAQMIKETLDLMENRNRKGGRKGSGLDF